MTEGQSAWGIRPGAAWAEEVDAEEERNGPLAADVEDFPTLGQAVTAPKKPKEKKKPQKMALGSFFSSVNRAAPSDLEILAQLPKGSSGLPREERDPSALGGGFREYGGDRGQGGFRGRRDGEREEREPSRADAANDWGAERKFTPSDSRSGGGGFGGGGFGDRRGGGGFEDRPRREDRPVSEADTADDWGANRKFTPSAGGGSGFGGGRDRDGGFRDRPRGGFEPGAEASRADTGDWGARRAAPAPEPAGPSGRDRRGYGFSDQPSSAADSEERWSHRGPPPDAPGGGGGGGSEQPAERPRLNLKPRTKPLEQPPATANGSAAPSPPASEAGSSSSGQQQQQQQPAPKKSNPFGEARPREEVLKEKGIDYQKEQLKLEHGEVLRDPTPEEVEMQKEVEELRVKLEGLRELTPGETDTIGELQAELDEREKSLYKLQAELDDRIRFSKNRPERERSSDSARGPAAAAAAGDDSGFEVVRNPRRERSATAAEVAEARSEADRLTGREGSGGAWGGRGGGGGGGGGGGFRERERPRDGSQGAGGGGRGEDRAGRGLPAGGGRAGGGEERGRESDRRPGRSGGGW